MAKKVWQVSLDGARHTVELEHGYWSGKRIIKVDGQAIDLPLDEQKKVFDTGSTHVFPIDSHECAVLIRTNGLTCSYDLLVDGVSEKTGKAQSYAREEPKPGFRWSISPEEYDYQIANYDTLSWKKSYRKQVALLFLFFQGVTLLAALFLPELVSLGDFAISFAVYAACLYFVYRGSQWAMLLLLGIWTFDKGHTLMLSVTQGIGSPIGSIIFWILGSLLILKAYRIETERKRRLSSTVPSAP